MAARALYDKSMRFVSLDTHPANNSLVVTYETLARESRFVGDVQDVQGQHTKRDQFEINVSALDELAAGCDPRLAGAPLDLRRIGEEILEKCPLLSSNGRDPATVLEEIQLNLQYLARRLQMQAHKPAALKTRPSSSAGRPMSAARAQSATGARAKSSCRRAETGPLDLFAQLCAKQLEVASGRAPEPGLELRNEFLRQLDAHLSAIENELDGLAQAQAAPADRALESADLNSHLEGLYGEHDERRRSIAAIRRAIRADAAKLEGACENRVLVFAMLRILRDSGATAPDQYPSKAILFCLIAFTAASGHQQATAATGADKWTDLLKVAVDLLERQASWLNKCTDLRQIVASFYYTNALLVLLANLAITSKDATQDANQESGRRVAKALVLQQGACLADVLVGLLETLAKYLARDTRVPSSRFERLTVTLRLALEIARPLVVYKEFVALLRAAPRARPLVSATISLVGTLQMSRPGSGTSQQQQSHVLVNDRDLLQEIYELELELLRLVTSLIYDARLRGRFMRKNLLLKCVLRNLVVFLAASRSSNTLSPFDRSPVLMVPFKCLYELTCSDKIKRELYRSKLILKCLLEYLVSATTDLMAELGGRARLAAKRASAPEAVNSLELHTGDQILLRPRSASHLILGVWLNLSARAAAPIYRLAEGNEELREPLAEYLQLAAKQLEAFAELVAAGRGAPNGRANRPTREQHLSVYVHSKLLRNLSQFVEFCPSGEPLQALTRASHLMLAQMSATTNINAQGQLTLVPLTVESLASVANFLDKQTETTGLDVATTDADNKDSIYYFAQLLGQLFGEPGLLVRGLTLAPEHDDLLLAAICLLGSLARHCEICPELAKQPVTWAIVRLTIGVLELKQGDGEMLTSCLFTLRQLANHSSFLRELGAGLEAGQAESLRLVEQLSGLLTHPDLAVVKLANCVLNMLKQFEELSSLNESVACQRRFAAYNSRWLVAVRAGARGDAGALAANRHSRLAVGAGAGDEDQAGQWDQEEEIEDNDERPATGRLDDEFRQLRTINAMGARSASSASISSEADAAEREDEEDNDERPFGAIKVARPGRQGGEPEREENDDENDDDDDEDEDETISEPDLNVIDANSMVKHLTNRREFRTELMRQ